MIDEDLDLIDKHMAQKLNIYRCAKCLASEMPELGRERVGTAFLKLSTQEIPDGALWYEIAACDRCKTDGPCVIVH